MPRVGCFFRSTSGTWSVSVGTRRQSRCSSHTSPWSVGGYTPYVQFGATHSAHSFTQAGANPTFLPGQTVSNSRGRFENPAYSVYDASFGVAKDAWYLNVYCENLSNSNASVFVSTDQFIVAQTPLRPRVLGAAFGYKF